MANQTNFWIVNDNTNVTTICTTITQELREVSRAKFRKIETRSREVRQI